MSAPWVLERADFDRLIEALGADGRGVLGPVLGEGAIVYEPVAAASDLPVGWTDEQAPGRYRLKRRDDEALFGYAVGPHSWKKYLFPPETRLWRAERSEDGSFGVTPEPPPTERHAFLGVRPCELAAIRIQDRVFLEDQFVDPVYAARRDAFVVVVHCGSPAGTCFCVSTDTGPRAADDAGYDLALTEVHSGDEHWFLVEGGSERGEALLSGLGLTTASEEQVARARGVTDEAAQRMGLSLETERLPEALAASPDSRRWLEVADRCLSCANCTMACPTCFCSDVEDVTDLSGDHAERWRRWDSCFTFEHSYVHGGAVRASASSRYRQWLTHKLSTWHDQFETSGCVGCGRCVTWCPVGIDLTEEAGAIRSEFLAQEGEREDDR
jgi:ferredoxin